MKDLKPVIDLISFDFGYIAHLVVIILTVSSALVFVLEVIISLLSKKHVKAFIRNRIKRLIRASVREIIKNGVNPYYVVVLPKVRESYDFFEFKKDLEFSLKKGNIISD